MRIAVDIMGGDNFPFNTIEGVLLAEEELRDDVELVLVGDEKIISKELESRGYSAEDFDIIHASQVITMNDHPTKAFRQKPDSSLSLGFNSLKDNSVDAFVGIGNTGAMMVGSLYSVRAITGVIRPCITSVLPREDGSVGIILDVGSNADCKPDVLYQFGVLGSIFAEYVYDIENPKVGLLNIGEEEEKGNLNTQAAYGIMKESNDFNFIGNVEGNDIFDSKVDVVVCDGFTGNIVLKQAEAMYTILRKRGLSDEYFDRFNYEIYGGTPVLGINSNVIIGHGRSSAEAIKNMILLTTEVVDANLPEKFKEVFN